MEITEFDKITIEKYVGDNSKTSLKTLYKIYDKYTGSYHKNNCFCSKLERERKLIEFFNWYDSLTN